MIDTEKVFKLSEDLIELGSDLPKRHRELSKLRDQSKVQYKAAYKEEEILSEVVESIRFIQENISTKTINYVEEFLTVGVQTVYHNRNFRIEIDLGDRGSRKTITFYVCERKGEREIKSHIEEGSGGGIQVVVAFLLQVLTILNRELARFIFIDENFSAISSEYLDGFFDIVDRLIEKFGFKFLMITQDPRFKKYATKTYKVKNGQYKLEEF